MLVNSKKSKTFVIENRSDKFDLKYVVSRVVREDADVSTRVSNACVTSLLCFDSLLTMLTVCFIARYTPLLHFHTDVTFFAALVGCVAQW